MIIDLSGADLGHEFKFLGGSRDGEEGCSSDYWRTNGEEFVDDFAPMVAGHVRIDLGPVATYVPEAIWSRMPNT